MLKYMDDRIGFYCPDDMAYIMDDYGTAIRVPWYLPSWYWQNH